MGSGDSQEIIVTPAEEQGFQLTKEFLDLAFNKEVEMFSTKVGTNPGDNFMSTMHAIEVTFKDEKETNHYLIKCYPNHPGRRDFLDAINVFSKEFFIYQEFLPQLKQLAIDCGAEKILDLSVVPVQGGNIVGEPNSKFTMKPWSDENFILMTDLRKSLGLQMADRMTGLDMDHTKIVLEEIAKYHVLSWAYKQKQGLKLLSDKYPIFIDRMYDNDDMMKDFMALMDHITSSSLKMTEEVLGSSHPACKAFKDFISRDTMEQMKEFLKKDGINELEMEGYLRVKPEEDQNYDAEPWLVGTHGDCWVNNMLFLYNDEVNVNASKKPVSVTLVDWQVNREACPTLDLAYFLFSSVRASIRIPNSDEILRTYHDAFIRYCDALQVKPLPGFSLETLARRFRRSQHFGFLTSLPMLNIVLKPPQESVDIDDKNSEQMADVLGSVMQGNAKNTLLRNEIAATALNLYETGVI